MAWEDLGEFLAALEERGDLARVAVPVDPDLELAEIIQRVSGLPGGGKGIFFEAIEGRRFPAVANIFGSPRRMAQALGVGRLDDLTPRMAEILEQLEREVPVEPEFVAAPHCREVVEERPDLMGLPLLRGWPEDGSAAGGRYLTLPLVVTADPLTGETNCGIYRVEALGPDRALIGWHPGSGGERHYHAYRDVGRMPVAVALGGPPELIFAASFSLPGLPDEYRFAGLLRNKSVPVTRCLTSDLIVPAAAELVIEGFVEPEESGPEGPFGNHTGFYAPVRQAPLFRVTTITRRRNPVIPVTVVGPPPQEDCWLAKAAERLMLPWLQRRFPEIVELSFPLETIFHRAAIVGVDTARCLDIPGLIRSLREEGPLRRAKVMVIVDIEDGVEPARAWWRAVNCCDWRRDLVLGDDGSLLGIDATPKPGQGGPLERRDTAALVDRRWREYGLEIHGTAKARSTQRKPVMDVEQIGNIIIGAAIKVHSTLGPGLLESAYQTCLAYELRSRGLSVECEVALPVVYGEVKIDTGYRIDMIVEDAIIIENKCVEKLLPIHEAQLLTYLKLRGCKLGYLLNWNVILMKDGIKRMVDHL